MTLEGEYYLRICPQRASSTVAILMTLEGEYYTPTAFGCFAQTLVAILMTLEGEYYTFTVDGCFLYNPRRNPHDIGRRILRGV